MSGDDKSSAPPALFDHCVRAYKAMLADSKAVFELKEDPPEAEYNTGGHVIVYEGFLTQLITVQLSLSVPYYTSVRKALINMGCIRQLRRGGGSSASQWEMIREPTLEAFMSQVEVKEKKPDKYEATNAQILALGTRVTDLEETLHELVMAWAREFGAKEVKE